MKKTTTLILIITISFLAGVIFSLYLLKWGWGDYPKYNCVNIITKVIPKGTGGTTYYKKLFCLKVPFWVN